MAQLSLLRMVRDGSAPIRYQNWPQIKEIQCPALRTAFYAASGEELRVLQRNFPHCFTENRDELCIPMNILHELTVREAARHTDDFSKVYRDGELQWWPILSEFGVPPARRWADPRCSSSPDGELPPDIWAQLVGKPLSGGMSITHEGIDLVIVQYHNPPYANTLGQPIDKLHEDYDIIAVEAHFIDMTA